MLLSRWLIEKHLCTQYYTKSLYSSSGILKNTVYDQYNRLIYNIHTLILARVPLLRYTIRTARRAKMIDDNRGAAVT